MDTRLFQSEKLYCEGKHKPIYRGYVHLYSLVLFPIGLWFLYNGIASSYAFTLVSLNLFLNFLCFGTSAVYHTGNWSLQTEIFLQKMDHIVISLWCLGMIVPVSLLVFPYEIKISTISLSVALCVSNCYFITISKPSLLLSAAIPSLFLFYLDSCFLYMNTIELIFMWGVYGFQCIGTMFFSLKITPSFCNNDIFGYHEIFHTMSILVSICLFIFEYSIASRYNDPLSISSTLNE